MASLIYPDWENSHLARAPTTVVSDSSVPHAASPPEHKARLAMQTGSSLDAERACPGPEPSSALRAYPSRSAPRSVPSHVSFSFSTEASIEGRMLFSLSPKL